MKHDELKCYFCKQSTNRTVFSKIDGRYESRTHHMWFKTKEGRKYIRVCSACFKPFEFKQWERASKREKCIPEYRITLQEREALKVHQEHLCAYCNEHLYRMYITESGMTKTSKPVFIWKDVTKKGMIQVICSVCRDTKL